MAGAAVTIDASKYFFSYARSDAEFVLRLARELRAAGAGIWVDKLDILGGERWDQAVEAALRSCQGMIVILSPQSVSSENVMDEVSFALGAKKLIVPVIKAECEVPFRLRRLQHVEFTSDFHDGLAELLKALRIQRTLQPDVRSSMDAVPTTRPTATNEDASGTTLVSPALAADKDGPNGLTPSGQLSTPPPKASPKPPITRKESAGEQSRAQHPPERLIEQVAEPLKPRNTLSSWIVLAFIMIVSIVIGWAAVFAIDRVWRGIHEQILLSAWGVFAVISMYVGYRIWRKSRKHADVLPVDRAKG
jgi:hypothetical protein